MESWVWLVGGIGLVIMELATPCGFFLFILGASAVIVGLVASLGLASSWVVQATLFCAVAVVSWLSFGRRMREARKHVVKRHGNVEGSIVKISTDIAPGSSGSGELWGTQWRIENVGDVVLEAGTEAVVVASEGLGLRVKKR
jgi:membrane protein implicated in regulation of membrane protease activity